MAPERPGYYAVIPADVRYDERLKPNAKLLYGEISALLGPEGHCFASNGYFEQLYGLNERTIRRLISQLQEFGYIAVSLDRNEDGTVARRRIYLAAAIPVVKQGDKIAPTPGQNCPQGEDKNARYNNLSDTKKRKSNKKKTDDAPDPLTDEELDKLFSDWIKKTSAGKWSMEQRVDVLGGLRELYGPRQMAPRSHPPIRSERGVRNLFSKLDKAAKGDYARVYELIDEAIARGWTSIVVPEKAEKGAVVPAPEGQEGGCYVRL